MRGVRSLGTRTLVAAASAGFSLRPYFRSHSFRRRGALASHRKGGMAMKHVCSIILGFGLSLVAAAFATAPANAQGLKTLVSIFGNDGMDCLTGPTACRTAQRA